MQQQKVKKNSMRNVSNGAAVLIEFMYVCFCFEGPKGGRNDESLLQAVEERWKEKKRIIKVEEKKERSNKTRVKPNLPNFCSPFSLLRRLSLSRFRHIPRIRRTPRRLTLLIPIKHNIPFILNKLTVIISLPK